MSPQLLVASLLLTAMEAHTNMGFVLSDQALIQTVWYPPFANGFIVSSGLPGSALLGMMKTSDLFT